MDISKRLLEIRRQKATVSKGALAKICKDVNGLIQDLIKHGHIDRNGRVQEGFWRLKDASGLILSEDFIGWQNEVYSLLQRSIISLSELHERITKSYQKPISYKTLHRVSLGQTKATLKSINQIAGSLGLTTGEFYMTDTLTQDSEEDSPVTYIYEDEPVGTYPYNSKHPDKACLKILTTSRLKNMSFDILALKPGEATRIEQDPAPADGITHEKLFFGTWGKLICIVDGKEYPIEKGKGVYFESHIPHYCKNDSPRAAYCVVAQSPRQ